MEESLQKIPKLYSFFASKITENVSYYDYFNFAS